MRNSMGQKMFSSNRISNSAIVVFLLGSFFSPIWACSYTWLENVEQQRETLAGRIRAPEGFERIAVEKGSFAEWLRNLPLKQAGANVMDRNNRPIGNQISHAAVIDINVLQFEQGANAILRPWKEHLYSQEKYDEIRFAIHEGVLFPWFRWCQGERMKTGKDGIEWIDSEEQDSSRESFDRYLNKGLELANPKALETYLEAKSLEDLGIGDLIVHTGSPGHAVIVLDMAVNQHGEKRYLLGQGGVPAQSFHVLKNLRHKDCPWYEISDTRNLWTSSWTFTRPKFLKFQ